MKDYFSGWPRYAERLFKRIDFLLGGLLAVLVFFLADHIQIGDYQLSHHRGIVTLVIAILALAESGYRVYREEHDMRTKFAAHVRVSAKLKRLAFDHPDPGPGQTLLTAEVGWEIWTDAEVFTDQLALNMIYVYDKRWWQFWKKTHSPQTGIPRKGRDNVEYRKNINTNMLMPFRDTDTFEYVAPAAADPDAHWLLELVLKTGMPLAEYRIPVFIDPEERKRRDTNPPL